MQQTCHRFKSTPMTSITAANSKRSHMLPNLLAKTCLGRILMQWQHLHKRPACTTALREQNQFSTQMMFQGCSSMQMMLWECRHVVWILFLLIFIQLHDADKMDKVMNQSPQNAANTFSRSICIGHVLFVSSLSALFLDQLIFVNFVFSFLLLSEWQRQHKSLASSN